MPKIFGDVKFNKTKNQLYCHKCMYHWDPTPEDKLDIKAKHEITCPVCRLVKGKTFGLAIKTKTNEYYVLNYGDVLNCGVYELLDDKNNGNIQISLKHINCGTSFKVRVKDLDKPNLCPKCYPKTATESSDKPKQIVYKPRTAQSNPSTETVKPSKPACEPVKKKKTVEDIKKSSKNVADNLMGQVINEGILVTGTDHLGQWIVQCIHCGREFHIPISQLSGDKRNKSFTCEVCNKSFGSDPGYIDKLAERYVGKVFNGLEITNVYIGSKGITLCDCECITNQYIDPLAESGHITEGLHLGDVINNKCFCEQCSKSSRRNKVLASLILDTGLCENFIDKNVNNIRNFGYNMKKEDRFGISPSISLGIYVNSVH